MEVSEILKELLFSHECVILPQFGGFITRNESAQFDRINYSFAPPRRIISFNPVLVHDDGLLVTQIAAKLGLEYSEAKKILLQEVHQMNAQLSSEGFLLMPGLGKLTKTNGIIEFSPQNNLNFNKELFGLPHFQAKRVLSTATKVEKASPFKEWQSYAAAVVFAMGIGAAGLYANKSMINSQLSSFYPVELATASSISTQETSTSTKEEKTIEVLPIIIPDLKEEKKEEASSIEIKPFQVIGGSHRKYYKAMEQEASLRRNGFPNAIIIGNVNNFTLVAYETFDNRKDAVALKRKLERKGKDVFMRVQ